MLKFGKFLFLFLFVFVISYFYFSLDFSKKSVARPIVSSKIERKSMQEHEKTKEYKNSSSTNAGEQTVELSKKRNTNKSLKLKPAKNGKIYFSAFPDFGGSEDVVSIEKIKQFEELVGRKIFWATFSQNWGKGMGYPKQAIDSIYASGAIPLVRFMPRTSFEENCEDQSFSLEKIASGDFDKELKDWARSAKQDGRILLVDFAVEANGNWFPWSGICHDKNPDIYKKAYRHIIEIFRNEGVDNVTWFFHFDINSIPNEPWNKPKNYYPGDDYIDWIGFSAYGPQNESENYWESLSEILLSHEQDVRTITKKKPIALMEFGVSDNNPYDDKSKWLKDALETIISGAPFHFAAINYWHENWEEKEGVYALLRVDSSPGSLSIFRDYAKKEIFLPKIKVSHTLKVSTPSSVSSKSVFSGTEKCVYNAAYAENSEADSLDNILIDAKDCYVLIDPFDLESFKIALLPKLAEQNTLSCYTSVGTAEAWRDDFETLKPYASEKEWGEWEGEYFIAKIDEGLVDIMKKRIREMSEYGCEYVEFDNMDWVDEENIKEYKLNLSHEDSRKYVRKLCDFSHALGMKCMAKSSNFDDAIFDGLTVESYPDQKNWWAENEMKATLWRGGLGLVVHYGEASKEDCEKIENYYKSIYGDKLYFLCEEKGVGYLH